jgi:hypothetical protein
MKRLAWRTDIHLNFVEPPGVEAFLASLAATEFDAFLIGGDIGDARMTRDELATDSRQFSRGLNTDNTNSSLRDSKNKAA